MVKRSRNFDKRDNNELLTDVNGNQPYEADMTKDSRKGDMESKKTKKQWVKDGSKTEERNDHFWERNDNKCRKESEVCLQKNHVGSVIEKAWVRKKKGWQQSLDNMEGTNMTLECPNESQNGTAAAGEGQGLDRIVTTSGQQTTKTTGKKSVGNLGFGAENMDELLTEPDKSEKTNQLGKSVEAFGESHDFESIAKEEKRKRKKGKCTVSEGKVNVLGHDIVDPKYKRLSNFNERDNNEPPTEITADAIAQSDVAKDEKKRKKKSKKGEAKSDDEGFKGPKPKKFKENVTFSGKDEVFQLPEDSLVRGKRFSKEEDEMVKEAVFKYIETHFLGEGGLEMVLNSKSHPKVRNCWKEIGTSLPHRPRISVYHRAQILFRRDEKPKWTKEQIEMLRAYQKKHGNHWRPLADELGKHNMHVASMWHYIKTANMKNGCWSQDEYQTLFDLVNLDLRMKYTEEKKSMHGMLRDNIPWTAISDRMTTRAPQRACDKWYKQLTSPMVEYGEWADSDDYRLIDALFELDASCYEDVDWDSLVEHRSGTICQKRWSEMVLHIGDNLKRSFADQVEVLAKRYCPELLEAKENWESKPVVP